jgi:hypothetical protein
LFLQASSQAKEDAVVQQSVSNFQPNRPSGPFIPFEDAYALFHSGPNLRASGDRSFDNAEEVVAEVNIPKTLAFAKLEQSLLIYQ